MSNFGDRYRVEDYYSDEESDRRRGREEPQRGQGRPLASQVVRDETRQIQRSPIVNGPPPVMISNADILDQLYRMGDTIIQVRAAQERQDDRLKIVEGYIRNRNERHRSHRSERRFQEDDE